MNTLKNKKDITEQPKKKNFLGLYLFKIKYFVLKHKRYFLILSLLLFCAVLWEFYSLHFYRDGIYAATVAQIDGDFEKANDKLQEVKAVTRRSFVLFIARKENVEQMIRINNEWRKLSEDTDSPTQSNQEDTQDEQGNESSDYIQKNKSTDTTKKEVPTDNTWSVDLPEFPDWETYQNLPKSNTKTYLCTDAEITTIQNRRYQIVDDIGKTELAKFNDRKACYDNMQAQREICIEQSCKVRMEVYWACIEATCGQYTTQTCDSIYNSPSHQYNVTLSSLNGELSSLNKSLEICWADRLQ